MSGFEIWADEVDPGLRTYQVTAAAMKMTVRKISPDRRMMSEYQRGWPESTATAASGRGSSRSIAFPQEGRRPGQADEVHVKRFLSDGFMLRQSAPQGVAMRMSAVFI
jgi:hypothetical protein